MAYATVEELKRYLEQIKEDVTLDTLTLLQEVLDRATSIIDGELGFSFDGYTPGTRTVYGWDTDTLWLPPHEVGSVTAVATAPGGTAITGWVESSDGRVYRESYYNPESDLILSWGRSRYAVTANWGYGDPPASITQVCLELAVNMWRARDKGLWTDVIGVEGAGGIRYIGGLTNQQRGIIEAARKPYKVRAGTISVRPNVRRRL